MNKLKETLIRQKVKKLLASKTPEEYIDQSVKSKLPQREKARATKEWLSQSDYTIADISYARNRHPYWKAVKQKNHQERTRKRFDEYNYSSGRVRSWSKDELKEFLDENEKMTDRELAKHFTRSIPSIQAIRRRINIATRILNFENKKRITKPAILKLILSDEKVLRRKLGEYKNS